MTTATAARPQADDAELARRIGARDERAFEAVMRAHNRMLFRIARKAGEYAYICTLHPNMRGKLIVK